MNSELRRHQTWAKLRDIAILLKPKISMLNVFTGVTAYVVAAGDLANLPLFVISGFLAASGSGALNHVLDADLDNKMSRTARRPIPSGRISKFPVLLMGLSMVITGLAIALLVFNPLTAFFIWLGVFIYVVVYTAWLKRRSVWNIVVGGLSGSCPPLAGWAAALNTVDALPLLMALLVFLWTPGHFWSLAIRAVKDYSQASIPMLPVKKGVKYATWATVLSNILTVVAGLLIALYTNNAYIYLMVSTPFSLWLAYTSLKAVKVMTPTTAWRAFKASSPWLFMVFAALIFSKLSA